MNLQSLSDAANNIVTANEDFEALDWASVYAKDARTTSGLSYGLIAGRWNGFTYAGSVLTLTNTTTNYIVAKRSDGVPSVSTASTNWDNVAEYARVYKLTTAGGVVTATEDHRAGKYGVFGMSARMTFGEGALDGSNPTSVAHLLATCTSFVAMLKGTAAPGVGTSVLTTNINGANVDVYAWKPTSSADPTLIASTGTENFYWIAFGV